MSEVKAVISVETDGTIKSADSLGKAVSDFCWLASVGKEVWLYVGDETFMYSNGKCWDGMPEVTDRNGNQVDGDKLSCPLFVGAEIAKDEQTDKVNKVTIEVTVRVNDEVVGSGLFDPAGMLTQADRVAGEALANTAASLFKVAHVAAIAFNLVNASNAKDSD
jgi:hypothetical protein